MQVPASREYFLLSYFDVKRSKTIKYDFMKNFRDILTKTCFGQVLCSDVELRKTFLLGGRENETDKETNQQSWVSQCVPLLSETSCGC